MISKLFFFCVLIISFNGLGQDTLFFENGNIQSISKVENNIVSYYTFFKNGTLESHSRTFLSTNESTLFFYYNDGSLASDCGYFNGAQNGVCHEYYQNGNNKQVSEYNQGIRNGRFQLFTETGVIIVSEQYRNGQLNGPASYFYSNGTLKFQGEFVDGEKEGEFVKYKKDGSVESVKMYESSFVTVDNFQEKKLIDSLYEWNEKYPDGAIFQKGMMKDGKLNGDFFVFHQNGTLISEGKFKEGQKDGEWFIYDEQGVLKEEQFYKKGLEIGTWLFYTNTSVLYSVFTFKKGEIITVKEFSIDHKGVIQSVLIEKDNKLEYTHPEGKTIVKYRNGNVFLVAFFKNNKKEGVWKWYTSSGELCIERTFENNLIVNEVFICEAPYSKEY